jgi:hypothetical protein
MRLIDGQGARRVVVALADGVPAYEEET